MFMKNLFKKILLMILCISVIQVGFCQKLLSDNAPINKKMMNVDSFLIKNIRIDDDIYENNWNNNVLFSYKNLTVPDNFKIDLRDFSMPVPNKSYTKITSRFGYRPRFGRMHYGVDLKVYTGDTIYSAFDGKVRIKRFDANGYGYYIVIRHKNGLETLYAHLSKQLVNINQEVKSGQPIGLGGNTGRSFGSHLHFETRIIGQAINPENIFDFNAKDVTCDVYVYNDTKNKNNNKLLAVLPNEKRHFYKVKQGDTLQKIAKKLGVSLSLLCKINHISPKNNLKPGKLLRY